MKRLIICADGTWNKPDQKDRGKRKPSNVVKMVRAILPKGLDGTHQIENAYHALAIDERRKPFQPTLWEAQGIPGQTLEQVWFAGVHTNIGGGYEKDGLANCAFQWMLKKAEANGLEFDKTYTAFYRPYPLDELRTSMTWYYRLLGEYSRPIGKQKNGHEHVDPSAIARHNEGGYNPQNLLDYLK